MYRNILDNACFKDCLTCGQKKKSSKNGISWNNLLKYNPFKVTNDQGLVGYQRGLTLMI